MKTALKHYEERLRSRRSCDVAGRETEFKDEGARLGEELNWKTAFLEAQVSCSGDGVLAMDGQGRKLLQNRRLANLFKIPQEIMDDPDDERQLRWMIEAIKGSGLFVENLSRLYSQPTEKGRGEIELKDGTILEWESFPAMGKDGRNYGRVWVYRDVTEGKRIEARLMHAQKTELVGKIAGGVAHEFNNLMTRIIGQGGLMLEDLPQNHSLAANVAEIHLAARRAAVLTHQLLAFGRRQGGGAEVFDLNQTVTGMGETVRHLAGRGVTVHLPSCAEAKLVRAEMAQIEEAIVNIVINAAEAMPHGGELMFETSEMALDESYTRKVPGLAAGDFILLAITDTGTGMSSGVKDRLFEPFFTTKQDAHGAGLGLVTCRRIAEEWGGHIAIYSDRGWGTSVRIYLPRASGQEERQAKVVDRAELPTGTETILLVEGNVTLRKIASMVLTRLGYSIVTVSDGIDALEAASGKMAGRIDLLLTDLVMPELSGKELSDRVHSLNPRVKTLFSSDSKQTGMVPQEVLARAGRLLQKPYTPSALADFVRAALDSGVNGNHKEKG